MSGLRACLCCLLAAGLLLGAGYPAAATATGDVAHASARIGDDDPLEIEALRRTHNLQLVFAEQGSGAYLADVRVRIFGSGGQEVLAAVASGPFFFVRLPGGRYRVEAEFNGRAISRTTSVSQSSLRDLYFYWPGD